MHLGCMGAGSWKCIGVLAGGAEEKWGLPGNGRIPFSQAIGYGAGVIFSVLVNVRWVCGRARQGW